MAKVTKHQPVVIRTERGLSVAGTRVTLYEVMDYVTAGWPPKLIRDRLNLTEQQVTEALAYIDAHRAAVEAEYQQVLREAEEARRYWGDHNRERFERIAATPPDPDRKHPREKLEEWKSRLEMSTSIASAALNAWPRSRSTLTTSWDQVASSSPDEQEDRRGNTTWPP